MIYSKSIYAFYAVSAVFLLCSVICISDEPGIQEQKPGVKNYPLPDETLNVNQIVINDKEQNPICSNTFNYPCEGYTENLRYSNFGFFVPPKDTTRFKGTYHLAEDVWVDAGTPVPVTSIPTTPSTLSAAAPVAGHYGNG